MSSLPASKSLMGCVCDVFEETGLCATACQSFVVRLQEQSDVRAVRSATPQLLRSASGLEEDTTHLMVQCQAMESLTEPEVELPMLELRCLYYSGHLAQKPEGDTAQVVVEESAPCFSRRGIHN